MRPLSTVERLALLAAVPAVLAVAGCRGGQGSPAGPGGPGGPGTAAAATAPAVAVSLDEARRHDIARTVDVTGSLVALQDVLLGPKLAGKIAAVYLREGDPVRAGQVVATMDPSDYQAQLQQAQAGLQAADTKVDQARTALKQARDQYQNAQTTLAWTDRTTQAGVATAQAGVQSAEAALDALREGARPQERQQAEEQVAAARANFEKTRSDLKRYQGLYREQAISGSQLDQAQAAFDAAQASYNSAQQALSLIKEGARAQDLRRSELAVKQAQEALARAQADRDQVRMRQQDVETARAGVAVAQANIRAAQAGVTQARAQVRLATDAVANTAVVSPISGFVAERRSEPGQQIGSGTPILRVVNPATVYFQATLSETNYGDVRIGQPAEVTVDALPGRKFNGRVTRVLPVASSAARSFTVRIDMAGDPHMRPQMFARGGILINTHRNATLVPKDAVVFDAADGSSRVFVAGSDGKAHVRRVRVGYSNPQDIEILAGARPGDRIIVAGQNNLSDGDRIKVD